MPMPDHALSGFPAENLIFPVRSLHLEVAEGEHPFVCDKRTAIAENWQAEHAANPSLYDGRMVLQHRLSHDDGAIRGRAFMIPFSAFLYWRRAERPVEAAHLFAMPLILTKDGALIAIRMAETTANPGRVYCAAGSMDASDVFDGRLDIDFNMRREVGEETGLDLGDALADPVAHACWSQNTVTIFRRFRFDLSEADIVERIGAHIASEAEPEISAAVPIRSADPQAHDYAFFMPPILGWLTEQKDIRP
ncbi:NUDIX hydrolase [Rhizobium alvei]|uniref:NUDIX hydrolase n=2 Tax=Rhizobium alvei TaxID=1132659 RepID=A0ABT8YI82_9HYPH|nr:NUDIX hydrolase [Rhizobium alvei]